MAALYKCSGCKEMIDYNMLDGKSGLCLTCHYCGDCGCECEEEQRCPCGLLLSDDDLNLGSGKCEGCTMEDKKQPCPTYDSVIAAKQLTDPELTSALQTLKKFQPTDEPPRCFAGNPVLYHYMMDALCNVKGKNGSFRELMNSESKRNDTWDKANKYDHGYRANNAPMRLFELWRRMNGAIVFFKPTIAMYVYKKYKATSVLDPTAGWGGRMLGAWASGIAYTGLDTNGELLTPYDKMMTRLNTPNLKMLFLDCLNADFSQIDYDCVLTSPPYINIELYPGMTPFASDVAYYRQFLIPLITKCRLHIKRGGKVCINISPKMYKALTKEFNYEVCKESVPLLQQKVQGKDKGDRIYVW